MTNTRHLRLRTLEGTLMGARSWALVSLDRDWLDVLDARLARVRAAIAETPPCRRPRHERLDELASLLDWHASNRAHAAAPDWERVTVLDDRLALVLDAAEAAVYG